MFLMLILGFFQAQSMMELAIRLDDEGHKDTRVRALKCGVNTTNTLCCLLMLGFSAYFVYPITYDRSDYRNEDKAFQNFMVVLGVTTGTIYGILTGFMIYAYVRVYRQLQIMIAAKMRVSDISRNVRQLFFVTLVSYVLRTVYLYGQGFYYMFVT
jgi:hypothetical protein